MKRTVVVLLLSLLAVAGVAAWRWWPRTTPPERVSDLYRRYEPNPHLSVAFIEGFKVNDTLAVDVTTVTALDDEGWDILRADFRIPELPDHIQKRIEEGKDLTGVRLVPKSDPTLPMDTVDITRNNVLGVSILKRTIAIFNTETESQIDATMNYNFRIQ